MQYKYLIDYFDYYDEDQVAPITAKCTNYRIIHHDSYEELRLDNPEYKEDQIIESAKFTIKVL